MGISKFFLKVSLALFFLWVLSSVAIKSSYASLAWQKYPINPVLEGRGHGSWEGGAALTPWILKKDNAYRIWYVGNNGLGWRIGYAESQDGVSNWSISPTSVIPVGTPDGWEKETINPSVIFDDSDNTFKMWYTSINTDHWSVGSDRFRVRYATSADGVNWSVRPGWVMYGTAGKWDEGGITGGISIMKINGMYKMWYTATNTNDEGQNPYWRIGYATSPDGIHWTKQNNGNPVIEPTQSWELNNILNPHVIYENGSYKIWYSAGGPTQIIYATSIDGINWVKPADANPQLVSSPNTFDSLWVGYPAVINDNGTYKMWYTGFSNAFRIGLATASANTSLNVPLLKQTSSPWDTDIYDSANRWSPTNPSIDRWGCALTSATMVLQYNGITRMPDNSLLDPQTVNNWLNAQPDGYVGNGLLNWIALQRLTKLAHLSGNNPGFTYDALIYRRTNTADFAKLADDLSHNMPDILEEPGHFIVATGTQGSTYTINDPYFDRLTLDDHYNNTFLSLGSYIPSHTDLSYIFLTAPSDSAIQVKDSDNNSVGESYLQQTIAAKPDNTPSGPDTQTFYLPAPSSQKYHVILSSTSDTQYDLGSYLYDVNGNVAVSSKSGNLQANNPIFLEITFNHDNANSSTITPVSYNSLIDDIKYFESKSEINKGISYALIAFANNVYRENAHGNADGTKRQLNLLQRMLDLFHGRGVSENAYQFLSSDISYLLSHL